MKVATIREALHITALKERTCIIQLFLPVRKKLLRKKEIAAGAVTVDIMVHRILMTARVKVNMERVVIMNVWQYWV